MRIEFSRLNESNSGRHETTSGLRTTVKHLADQQKSLRLSMI
ncbi:MULTISPECIES: hypothetical protein [unclassified Streptomyces]